MPVLTSEGEWSMRNGANMKRVFLACALLLLAVSASFADVDAETRWTRSQSFADKAVLGNFTLKVTYFSADHMQTVIREEAQKNMWTKDEEERFKFQLLNTTSFEKYLPFYVVFENNGPSMHMSPFDEQVYLWVGKKKIKPVDYDRMFNLKLQGKREGFVFFPRYDEKTGKPLLEGVKNLKLVFNYGIHDFVKNDINFIWDVDKDSMGTLMEGKAAAKLEIDRLLKRLQILNEKKRELEGQLADLQGEIQTVDARIAELQKQ